MKSVDDYALIGDLRTAALIHRNGSVEWFCAPRFDSSASFAALLGNDENGYWRIAPVAGDARIERRYVGDTLVLETTCTTATGSARVTDFMPVGVNHRTIVRIVEGVAGHVAFETVLAPKMKYGLLSPPIRREAGAWTFRVAPHALALHASIEMEPGEHQARGSFPVHAGERTTFTLQSFDAHEPVPGIFDAMAELARTRAWWESWASGLRFDGEWRDRVLRSAITLKALSYEPAGSFVAAVTTSLPEQIGGSKNWDYRYCWLRDASFTAQALLRVGFVDESRRWRDWFMTIYVDEPEHLHIMYAVDGDRLPEERTLSWLSGFEASSPVRVANGAHEQFQLGVFGEVLTAFDWAQRAGVAFDPGHWTTVETLMRHVERVWQNPGNGIWETRDGGHQYTISKVMAWVALERGLALAARGGYATDTDRWRALQKRIHAQVCAAGFDPDRNTFTQYYGSTELDASLLLMPLVGFLPADDSRVRGTVAAIENELFVDGYVYRDAADNARGVGGPDEGSFTMCGFWLVEVYVMLGRSCEARALFERLLRMANDVGLFSEEFDVAASRAIGNVPQAFSHVGAINAALRLSSADKV